MSVNKPDTIRHNVSELETISRLISCRKIYGKKKKNALSVCLHNKIFATAVVT